MALLHWGGCIAGNREIVPHAFDPHGAIVHRRATSIYPTSVEFVVRLPIFLGTARFAFVVGLLPCFRQRSYWANVQPDDAARSMTAVCPLRFFLETITIDNRCLPRPRFSVRL